MKHNPLSSPGPSLSPDMYSALRRQVRTRSRDASSEDERLRATVTPDGASSTAPSGSTDGASTTSSDDELPSPPRRRVVHSTITASSSYRDPKNRVDPLSPATRAACTRTFPDFVNMPDGLTPLEQAAFMRADLAAYNAEIAARKAEEEEYRVSDLRSRRRRSSTGLAIDDDDEDEDDEGSLDEDNLDVWGFDFEPARPQRSLLSAVDPRQAFVNAVETVIPTIDVAQPPTLDRIRAMSPWEREVHVEAHREAMRRRHREQMGERRYARAAAAGWRAEETSFEEENMAIEAARGFGGLAFERPEVLEEWEDDYDESEKKTGEPHWKEEEFDDENYDDDDDDDDDDEDTEDEDTEIEDTEDEEDFEGFEDDDDMPRKRVKLESGSPTPLARRLRGSITGQRQSSPKEQQVPMDDLDDDMQILKMEFETDD